MANKKVLPDKCPICNSKMEKGFITARQIAWNEQLGISAKHFGGGEKIVALSLGALPSVGAYRCKNCKLVIFRYDKQIT